MIDHESNVPVYVQLANLLRAQIESGELASHRALPSISYMMGTYGVSDGTVKRAVGILRSEGLVETVSGKGVFVRGPES